MSAAITPSAERDATELGARLYETYAGELLRFCRRQLRSAEEAEDALQTTFVDAVQRTTETYAVLTRARRSMAEALAPATGRASTAINLGSLVLKLRGLLFGGAAKTAATGLAVAAAAAGGVAVERSVDRPPSIGTGPSAATAIVSTPDDRDRRRGGDARPRGATQASIRRTNAAPSAPSPSSAATAPGVPSAVPVAPQADAQPNSGDASGPTTVSSDPATPLPTPPVVDLGAGRDSIPVPDLVDELNTLLPPVEGPIESPVPPDSAGVTEPAEDLIDVPGGLPEPPVLPDPALLP